MKSLTAQFLSWCRSKPADEEYDYFDGEACALAQFARFLGMAKRGEYVALHRFPDRFTNFVFGRVYERPVEHTFGALADRVERQLAEQGQVS